MGVYDPPGENEGSFGGSAYNLLSVNLPNAITIARIALVPVFLVFAYAGTEASSIVAFVVFVVASLSDFVDGYLARQNEDITRLGQFLDPLADKLLVGAALWTLVDLRNFPLWAALVIAARELAVQVLRTRVVSAGGSLPASPAAKTKTFVQIGLVSWWLLPWDEISTPHWVWLGAALATTLWSGVEYFAQARSREVV